MTKRKKKKEKKIKRIKKTTKIEDINFKTVRIKIIFNEKSYKKLNQHSINSLILNITQL